MEAASDRLAFAPPPPPGMLRAFGLALVAHALLVAALTWGVNWHQEAEPVTVEAELWASVPQQAAPKPVEAPPPVPEPQVEAPAPVEPVIVQEKVKPKPPEAKPEPPPKPTPDPKLLARQKASEEAQKIEAQRQQQLQRIAGLAGATGESTATGSALHWASPSASYAGRIKARVKPNIVFTDEISGNPEARVLVRTAPDGTIVSRSLLKSSGNKAWDDAVLKAIDKTEVLPRDVDGRVPSSLDMGFTPRD